MKKLFISASLGQDRLKLRLNNSRVYQPHMLSLVFFIFWAFFNFNLKDINFDLKGYQFQLKVNFKQINYHKNFNFDLFVINFQFWPICDQFLPKYGSVSQFENEVNKIVLFYHSMDEF